MMPIWFLLSLGSIAPFLEQNTIGTLQWAFGDSPAIEPTIPWRLFYGLVSILIVTCAARSSMRSSTGRIT